jgi:hypothetical protein
MTVWYAAETLRVLKANLRFWHLDPISWLRDNMPTLAKYA